MERITLSKNYHGHSPFSLIILKGIPGMYIHAALSIIHTWHWFLPLKLPLINSVHHALAPLYTPLREEEEHEEEDEREALNQTQPEPNPTPLNPTHHVSTVAHFESSRLFSSPKWPDDLIYRVEDAALTSKRWFPVGHSGLVTNVLFCCF